MHSARLTILGLADISKASIKFDLSPLKPQGFVQPTARTEKKRAQRALPVNIDIIAIDATVA
jgi:hypothetical protein